MTQLIDLANQHGGLLDVASPQLTLCLTTGTGSGPNTLAAFDAALFAAGIANFNLLRLSSVIPPGSTLINERPTTSNSSWGDRLYVVMSEGYTTSPGDTAWAGIGWVQNEEDLSGLFVEHHGESQDEVEGLIQDSLTSMVSYRDKAFGPIQMETVGVTGGDNPSCALVAVVYGSEAWNTTGVTNLAEN